jgi:isopenicillin-N N-acyltransferase-like protein
MDNGKQNVVTCSGSPTDRGNEYGRKLKDLINRLVQSHYSFYARNFHMDKDQVLREAKKYIPFIENYSTEIAEEIQGTAEGAGVSLQELVMVIAFPEMYYPRLFGHCTAFAVGGEATAGGEVYVGQNEDEALDPWLNGDCAVLVAVKRKDGPDVLTYTYAGVPSMKGINSAGIAMCINALTCEQSKLGVPSLVVTRELLYQKTIGDAIGAITRATRANSLNYVVADSNGELYDIEATPNDYDYIYSDRMVVHSNHFLSQRMKIERDFIKQNLPDTCIRSNRMQRLLKAQMGKIDVKILMSVLRDHINYPNSICRHPNPAEPEATRGKTLDSIIWVAKKKEAWLAKDSPCQGTYYKYSLDGSEIGEERPPITVQA